MPQNIITKDSGKRQVFTSGYQRDTEEGKIRPDLIPLDKLDHLQAWYAQSHGHHIVTLLEVVDKTNPPITGHDPNMDMYADELYLSLIPEIMLNRLAGLYKRGAEKYGLNNWQKGANLFRFYGSALRHLVMWFAGDTSEDHLAAVIWNVTTLMWTENQIREGKLSTDLADAGPLKDWYNVE
jgi:hypothetical protein